MIIKNWAISDFLKKYSKVLLINPPIYDYLSHTNPDSMGRWGQPTGLLRISTFLKLNGCNVSLFDCLEENDNGYIPTTFRKIVKFGNLIEKQYHIGMSFEDFEKRLYRLSFYPEQIYITSIMTYWWESVKDTIALLKKVFPKSELILGGIYPTLLPEHAEEHTSADIIIQGKVEEVFNLWTDFSLYEKSPNYAVILSSEGCPWNCSYCAQKKINEHVIRYRDPDDVVAEIETKNKQYGIKKFVFFADNFLTNKIHFQEILERIISKNLQITLDAPKGFEPDLLDVQTLRLMRNAGWKRINLALETVNKESRQNWHRKHTNEMQFRNAVELCRCVGFPSNSIHTFVLYGMPAEDLKKVKETAKYIHHQGAFITPMPYTPVPGSTMYSQYLSYIERKVDRIEMLHERLFPFSEYNGYTPKDYLHIENFMDSLNSKLRNSINNKNQVGHKFAQKSSEQYAFSY